MHHEVLYEVQQVGKIILIFTNIIIRVISIRTEAVTPNLQLRPPVASAERDRSEVRK